MKLAVRSKSLGCHVVQGSCLEVENWISCFADKVMLHKDLAGTVLGRKP